MAVLRVHFTFCPQLRLFASLAILSSLYIFRGILLSLLGRSSHLLHILLSYLVFEFGVTTFAIRRCAHNICANYVCDIRSWEKQHTDFALNHSLRETPQIFLAYNTVGAGTISVA